MSRSDELDCLFSEVIPQRLFFGGFPSSKHIVKWREKVEKWGQKGITFIDLTTDREKERFNLHKYDACEGETMGGEKKKGFTITYYHYPITDNSVPVSETEYVSFLSWLIQFYRQTANPLLIHCKGGHGRSAMVVISLLSMLYKYPITESMNRVTQLHHTRPGLHHRYYQQLCPVSPVQQHFLVRLFRGMDDVCRMVDPMTMAHRQIIID